MRMAELLSLPTVIVAPGQYQTRCGETVTIDRVGRSASLPWWEMDPTSGWAFGHYDTGIPESWDVSGRVLPFSLSDNDILGKLPDHAAGN